MRFVLEIANHKNISKQRSARYFVAWARKKFLVAYFSWKHQTCE